MNKIWIGCICCSPQSVHLDVMESTVPSRVIVQLVFHVMSSQEPVVVLPVGKEPHVKGVSSSHMTKLIYVDIFAKESLVKKLKQI